ncbi:hypothetical protein ABPG75_013451 [Micractinium tetrahymenae]
MALSTEAVMAVLTVAAVTATGVGFEGMLSRLIDLEKAEKRRKDRVEFETPLTAALREGLAQQAAQLRAAEERQAAALREGLAQQIAELRAAEERQAAALREGLVQQIAELRAAETRFTAALRAVEERQAAAQREGLAQLVAALRTGEERQAAALHAVEERLGKKIDKVEDLVVGILTGVHPTGGLASSQQVRGWVCGWQRPPGGE